MNELLSELGLTEEAYRSHPISRRNLLKLAGIIGTVFIIDACSPSPRRWSRDEIINFGRSMQSEPQFNDVAYAGWVLVESQSKRPSLSRLSPLFVDEPIKMTTVENLGSYIKWDIEAPMVASVTTRGPKVQVTLRSKTDRSVARFSSTSALQLGEIVIDRPLASKMSDFVFKLYAAKEIFNTQALDTALSYMVASVIGPYYFMPEEELARRAVTVSRLFDKVEGVPIHAIADRWAHYYLVPNYLVAAEEGRISRGDWGKDDDYEHGYEALFRKAAEIFLSEGVLFKNSAGVYRWTDNSDRLFRVWMEKALVPFRAKRLKTVQSNHPVAII